VGSAVRKLTAENLTEALLKATTDEKQIAKAKVVGEMIRKVCQISCLVMHYTDGIGERSCESDRSHL
jgi:hypothetical protein